MVQIQNTVDIGWSWHWISLGQTFMIFWHMREHPTGHLYSEKKISETEKSHQSAVHTPDIGIDCHLIGLCQNFMIFWHTREHPTGHLIAQKNKLCKKTSGTNSNSGTKYFVPLFSGTKYQNQKSLFGHPSSLRYRS